MGFGKFFALAVMALCLAGFAAAQVLTAPGIVEITRESREFSIKAFNDSNQSQFLGIELVSPIGYEVSPVPSSIPAFASQTFKIKLLPSKEQSNETIQSLLVARLGSSGARKKIILEIRDFTSKKQNTDSNAFAGFIVLPSIGSIGWEQVADIALIVIIIILVIALIARLVSRKYRKKASEEFK